MNKAIKYITSFLLLLVFLIPTVVKLEHNHENFKCKAKNKKHYHTYHKPCDICSIEFSIFNSNLENDVLKKKRPADKYNNIYRSANYTTLTEYSFLLRAPPYNRI